MAANPREILNDLKKGSVKMAKAHPECSKAFNELGKSALQKGALDTKTKELIAAALGVAARCDYCIVHHVYESFKAGATRQELLETACVATFMGGGPNLTYSSTLFIDAIDEFAKDFDR
ncbi:MAG: carboxymuconolactone decarboxylase family protein [Dehalococcoidales bacterium]|nr:carboxymuconolactone decarboxylase family protein [Dehalococcoidales bacterium]